MMRSCFRRLMLGVLAVFGCSAAGGWAADFGATPADQIRLPEGFRAELLYSVPDEQGSWVSMTTDPKGRLIASDQYGSLFRIEVGPSAEATRVEQLDVEMGEAQGLLYAFDSLYVVVNGNAAQGPGLYRLRDTDGNDQFDEVQLLRKIRGGGEHGPHAVILSPDGKSLYLAAGNHTELPDVERSRVPRNWDEDQLLPRMWDAGGHAVGRMAPGGWICRTDPDGKVFELVSSGYRNEYDIAFHPDGELFTFDADMEWDIGAPWYRPTRVCHATSGSEFGWRSGTGKWPEYYPDNLPAAVDIGPGSPTGICFGTGAKFPEKYQRALFIADWSYGLIYAVHLTSDGASYGGEFEKFATAAPLPVTDMLIRPQDGALYFAIGGRRTQSGLYRVSYQGDAATTAVDGRTAGAERRRIRHELEAFHGVEHPDAIDTAWPYLKHADRFLRYAARIALEHQPVEQWQERALQESDPQALITGLVALARQGSPELQKPIIEALGRLEWNTLSEMQQLAVLRVYGLAFIRLGEPGNDVRQLVLERIDARYPAEGPRLNRELSKLLIYLEAPGVAERTVDLMAQSPTQEEQLDFALSLRNLKQGWTPEQRQRYFSWFRDASQYRGGHSFALFLRNIREEAAASLSDRERRDLGELLEEPPPAETAPEVARPFVRKWEVDDLLSEVQAGLRGRSLKRGRDMFAATNCFKCHRFAGEGGIIGPDLTGVARRFDARYLLESLIEPSKAVSDQYQASVFVLDDGRTVVGKVANLNGNTLAIITNMLEPGNATQIRTEAIEEVVPSPVSMMPTGLLDSLRRDEVLDLVAYLQSGGDPQHPVFVDK